MTIKKTFTILLLLMLSGMGVMAEAHHHFDDADAAAGRAPGSRFISADDSPQGRCGRLSHGACPICSFISHSHCITAGETGPDYFFPAHKRPLPACDIIPGSSSLAAISTRAPPSA